MDREDIDRYIELMKLAKELPIKERRMTFFDIAGRGHYENPLSDLLRFFISPNECHGFGTSILAAFCQACGLGEDWVSTSATIHREFRTKDDKRLDIAIILPDRAILVETKVYHAQVNPFDNYEDAIARAFNVDRDKLAKFVLSPHGNVAAIPGNSGWIGIGFIQVANQMRAALSGQELSTWRVLGEELAAHLINLGEEPVMDQKILSFAEKHLSDIKALEDMKRKYYEHLQYDLLNVFIEATGDEDARHRVSPWGDKWGAVITIHPTIWGNAAQAGFAPTFADDNSQCGAVIWAAKGLPEDTAAAVTKAMVEADVVLEGREGNRPVWSKYGCKTIADGRKLFQRMVEIYHRIAVVSKASDPA